RGPGAGETLQQAPSKRACALPVDRGARTSYVAPAPRGPRAPEVVSLPRVLDSGGPIPILARLSGPTGASPRPACGAVTYLSKDFRSNAHDQPVGPQGSREVD